MTTSLPLGDVLPLGSADESYLPSSTASEIINFQLGDDGSLKPVGGITPYVPDYTSYGRFHGAYHTRLENGARDLLLIRHGDLLQVHNGPSRGWVTLKSGLSDDANARYPDVFVEVAGKVIWCNGIDSAYIYDGWSFQVLGYDRAPGAPTPQGPEDVGDPIYRNFGGYNHPGRIGTMGDFLSGQEGSLLTGFWYYYGQYEDQHGNLSPLSAESRPVTVRAEKTAVAAGKTLVTSWKDTGGSTTELNDFSVTMDDLGKQFAVILPPDAPEGTVAFRLYRSADAARNDKAPRFLVRLPGASNTLYLDNTPDAELGSVAKRPISFPTFKVACEHQGRLICANTSSNPNRILASELNLPGTLLENSFVDLPEECTGLASFQGKLLAFTRKATYALEIQPDSTMLSQALSESVGCVAPASLCAAGWDALVWLSESGLYQLQGDNIQRVSDPKYRTLNRSLLGAATNSIGVWHAEAREYLLFYPDSGSAQLKKILTFDGANFRERDYGINLRAVCVTKDHRSLLLAGGVWDGEKNFWVLNRRSYEYIPPVKTYKYISAWMSPDATRRKKFNVSTLYVCFQENTDANISTIVWGNGRRPADAQWGGTLRAVPDDWPGGLGTMVLGTSRLQNNKTFWKKIDVNLRSVDSFSFGLKSTGASRFTVVAWACDAVLCDQGARVTRG